MFKSQFSMKKVFSFASIVVFAALAACTKPGGSGPVTTAQVMFVNGCAGTVNVNVTEQGTAVPNATNMAFFGSSGYQTLSKGTDSIAFVLTSTGTPLVSSSVAFAAKANYSVFLGGLVSKVGILAVNDDMAAPTSGDFKIRIVNLSLDALSLTGNAGTTAFATGIGPMAASAFQSVAAGSFGIAVGDPSDISTVKTLATQQYVSGKIYTVIYTGTSTGSLTSGYTVTLINNN